MQFLAKDYYMKRLYLCAVILCFAVASQGQGSVKVTIVNDKQAGIENATVEVIRKKDSSLVKAAIADRNGLAEFENIHLGEYLVRVSMVNFSTEYSQSFSLSTDQTAVTIPAIMLLPKTGQLGGVTVTARKPFIQKLSDRIVVNVENSIVSAGSSALDVLEM